MIELKPCPSCDSKHDPSGNSLVVLCRDSYPCAHFVTCRWCGMSGPRRRGEDLSISVTNDAMIVRDNLAKQEAIDAWNALPRKVEPQPIETAPDDGTWILVCEADYECWMSAQWGLLNINPNKYDGAMGWSGHGYIFDGVTHWLPMPPLPEVKE